MQVPASRTRETVGVSVSRSLERLHREPPSPLLELERHGRADGISFIDRGTGRLLSTLVHAMQAHRILEIGTAYGYATLWMALAMPDAGRLWTIDPDTERTAIARDYFRRAGVEELVEIVGQPALEVIPLFPHRNLDLVFIDALKSEYAEYLEAVIPMVKRSGLIVIAGLPHDVPEIPATDEKAAALQAFSATFLRHPLLDATIVPIGEGIGIGARVD